MQTRRGQSGITFSVENVERAQKRLPTCKTRDGLLNLLNGVNTNGPAAEPVIYCSGYNSDSVAASYNSLFAAVHLAFAQHRPLVLSPDMIWIAILQGFAIHVHNNSEELRPLLVHHEGRQTLAVAVQDVDPNSPESGWDGVIHLFSLELSKRVGLPYNELVSRFSTTGRLERLVCEVTLMDVFEPYYQFVATCVCGIPEITLEGTTEDWQLLRKQIDALERYDLEWWVPHLRRIADQFVAASRGDVDLVFWQNIYKLKQAYGASRINGWFGKLAPYLKNWQTGKYTVKNPLLDEPDIVVEQQLEGREALMAARFNTSGITSDQLPSGLSQVPFVLETILQKYPMELLAGFIGIDQNEETMALRPRLGWGVRRGGLDDFLAQVPDNAEVVPPVSAKELDRRMAELSEALGGFWSGGQVPTALVTFYSRCDGIVYGAGRVRFLPIEQSEVQPVVICGVPDNRNLRDALEAQGSQLKMLKMFEYGDGSYAAIVLGSNPYMIKVLPNGEGQYASDNLMAFIEEVHSCM